MCSLAIASDLVCLNDAKSAENALIQRAIDRVSQKPT
jgi:hypothetical protein